MKIILSCCLAFIVNFTNLSGDDILQQMTVLDSRSIDFTPDSDLSEEVIPVCTEVMSAKLKSAPQIEQQVDQDLEIFNLFTEPTFKKLSVNYKWEGKTYPVHFVYNPMKEVIYSSELSLPVRWPFAMTISASTYPVTLINHLKSLVPEKLLRDWESMIDISDWSFYTRKHSDFVYTDLHPITVLNQIDNPDIDAEIVSLFQSERLKKKSVYYELKGQFYAVFLIHNPKKIKLKSTGIIETSENGRLVYTYSWNSKVGVFVDKRAPQKLIDHISKLYKLSWWDNFWNLTIHNGNELIVKYQRGNWTYTYAPCSYYTCILKAKK